MSVRTALSEDQMESARESLTVTETKNLMNRTTSVSVRMVSLEDLMENVKKSQTVREIKS